MVRKRFDLSVILRIYLITRPLSIIGVCDLPVARLSVCNTQVAGFDPPSRSYEYHLVVLLRI